MNQWQRDVRQFHITFKQPAPEQPTFLTAHQRMLRCRLLLEETMEYIKACGFRLGHIDQGGRTMMILAEDPTAQIDPIEQIDGLVDVIYIALGSAIMMGLDLQPFWEEVHGSNMRKVGADGKAHVREDGKILKPEGWEPPNIGKVFLQERAKAGLLNYKAEE